jgi:uncharacterized repeat protein (TIGR02543 family)
MKNFMKKYGGTAAGNVLFALAILIPLAGCPADVVEGDPSAVPAAVVATGVHSGEAGDSNSTQKAVVFSLTSSHPVDAIWKVYAAETGGEAISGVSASYDPDTKKLTLTALQNDLPVNGVYWVSVTERGRDESRRLKLTVKYLYPLTIIYNANGGTFVTGGITSPEVWTDSAASIPSPSSGNPNREGFVFAGWNEKADGSGETFPWEAGLAGDVYVYAKWLGAGTPYTVTFHANGGSFPGNAETLEKTGTFVTGGSRLGATNMPSSPTSSNIAKYTFDGWNTRADGLGTVFTGDTLITSTAIDVYAKWTWSKNSASLKLWHNFANGTGTTVTPAKTPSDGGTYTATMMGEDGVRGSKTIGGTPYYYYKTGAKRLMSNTSTSYLNLGDGAGTVLKSAAGAYTMAVYVRINGDRSGNGSFIWTFATGNSLASGSGGAVYFIATSSRNEHCITLSGYSAEKKVIQNGVITNGTWLHVAYTQDGTTGPDNARLYVNGVEVVKGTVDALPADIGSALTFNTLAGPCYTGDNNLSETMFADFRIYDEALEELQIRELAADLKVLNSVGW